MSKPRIADQVQGLGGFHATLKVQIATGTLLAFDLIGTFVFALTSSAASAVNGSLQVFIGTSLTDSDNPLTRPNKATVKPMPRWRNEPSARVT